MTLRHIRIAGFAALVAGLAWTALSFWEAMPVSARPEVSGPPPPPSPPPPVTAPPGDSEVRFDLVSEWSSNAIDVTLPIGLSLTGLTLVLVTTSVSILRRRRV